MPMHDTYETFKSEASNPGVAICDNELDGLTQTLKLRLEKLWKSIDSTAENRKPVELDQASVGRLSRMDAMQMQAMAQAAGHMQNQEISRIEATLKRIEAGDFGDCVICGEKIAPKRLAVDLTVSTCIGCAAGRSR